MSPDSNKEAAPAQSANGADTPAALAVDALEFSYGRQPALQQASLEVPRGRFVALFGANGAGKTTLFSIVTGLYASHRGSISVMGYDIRSATLKALASMGVVFQRTTLDLDLTVYQNLRYFAALQGLQSGEARRRIEAGIQSHGLSGLDARKVASLSGGQRRRVELARSLLHRPSLLLLDEPTVGLDLQSRSEFVSHVKNLCKQQGTGVLWATHLVDEVADDDLVYILDKGRIIATGELGDLLRDHGADNVGELFETLAARPKA